MLLNTIKKSFLLIMASFMIFTLTSCGNETAEANDSAAYDENLDAYEGIWYSGDDNGQAYRLLGHGMYSKYSITLGEDPEQTESGLFKKVSGEDVLSFGNPVDGTFTESYRLQLQGEIIVDGDTQFQKVTSDIDPDFLSTLMTMDVPMEMYLGEWVNDSAHLTIEDSTYSFYDSESIKAGDIDKMTDHLILYMSGGQFRLEPTEDGGLILEDYSGTFYRPNDEE